MQKAIIFGCGDQGRQGFEILKNQYNIVALSDNNPQLWGGGKVAWANKLTVVPPAEIKSSLGDDGIVIICNWKNYPEIARQLEDMDICDSRVYRNTLTARYDSKLDKFNDSDWYINLEPCPKILHIALSHYCNIKCIYCNYHSELTTRKLKPGFMSFDMVNEITRQAKGVNTFEQLHFVGSGEPMLNPNWFNIVKFITTEMNIQNVIIYTNGMILNKENVENLNSLNIKNIELSISIDGLSPEDSEFWRKGSNYSVIKENIIYAYKNSNKNISFKIESSAIIPDTANKDFLIKSAEFLHTDFPFVKINRRHTMAYVDNIPNTITRIEHFNSSCLNAFEVVAVNANGKIVLCPCSLSGNIIIGDIMENNMVDIWTNSPKMNNLRASFYQDKVHTVCQGCYSRSGDCKILLRKS